MTNHLSKNIVLLGTGGTITGVAADPDDNLAYTAGQLDLAQLLEAIPGLAPTRYALVSEQIAQLDSKDMSFAVWQQLALRCAHWLGREEVQGIVVTHGSDTLEETAFFLNAVLPPDLTARKPVVLTCAMRPASSRFPDGPQNLLDAVALACDASAQGVLAVCAGRIHGALHLQKLHPYRLDAFDSGDAGPLGFVEEGQARWVNMPMPTARTPLPGGSSTSSEFEAPARCAIETVAALTRWPRVEIVMNYAGASGLMVDALLAHAAQAPDPVRGLVVAGTGNGTVHHDLEAALLRAQAAGVRVVRSTRCVYGRVLPTAGARIPDAKGLSPVKARVALLLELAGVPAQTSDSTGGGVSSTVRPTPEQ